MTFQETPIEDNLDQLITDTEINPMTVLQKNKKKFDGVYTTEGKFHFRSEETISQEQYETMTSEKTNEEWLAWSGLSSDQQAEE